MEIVDKSQQKRSRCPHKDTVVDEGFIIPRIQKEKAEQVGQGEAHDDAQATYPRNDPGMRMVVLRRGFTPLPQAARPAQMDDQPRTEATEKEKKETWEKHFMKS